MHPSVLILTQLAYILPLIVGQMLKSNVRYTFLKINLPCRAKSVALALCRRSWCSLSLTLVGVSVAVEQGTLLFILEQENAKLTGQYAQAARGQLSQQKSSPTKTHEVHENRVGTDTGTNTHGCKRIIDRLDNKRVTHPDETGSRKRCNKQTGGPVQPPSTDNKRITYQHSAIRRVFPRVDPSPSAPRRQDTIS